TTGWSHSGAPLQDADDGGDCTRNVVGYSDDVISVPWRNQRIMPTWYVPSARGGRSMTYSASLNNAPSSRKVSGASIVPPRTVATGGGSLVVKYLKTRRTGEPGSTGGTGDITTGTGASAAVTR